MLISIIIPVYNEEDYIKELLTRVNSIKELNKEIIVVNDKSTDNTKNILENECKSLYSKLINNEKNMGKGFACRKGIDISTGDIIIIQDADLEYNPENYIKLIEPIKNDESKVVYGSRVLPGAKRTRPKTLDFKIRYIANIFLTFLSNILNKQSLSDCHTCYKVFSADILKSIDLYENGFTFCPEITAKVSRLGIKIKEVPIDYYGRTHDQGKKIFFIDGIKAIYSILKYNLFKNT
jgi:glycosyltransferase involved in cell wall biosynthesis|tara:strand:+ start:227 stop:934 length:708 start_codon:yes stop_codon:yes gene_type:complete